MSWITLQKKVNPFSVGHLFLHIFNASFKGCEIGLMPLALYGWRTLPDISNSVLFVSTFQTCPPMLPPLQTPLCSIHPSALPPSLRYSIIPIFPLSSHPSFLSPLVPTPHFLPFPFFSIHPSRLNNADPTQLHCHCPRLNVNVVSLSQLLGHYHPSQLIIVMQRHRQTIHIRENKGAHRAEKHVAVYDACVKLNDVLW